MLSCQRWKNNIFWINWTPWNLQCQVCSGCLSHTNLKNRPISRTFKALCKHMASYSCLGRRRANRASLLLPSKDDFTTSTRSCKKTHTRLYNNAHKNTFKSVFKDHSRCSNTVRTTLNEMKPGAGCTKGG